MGETRRGRYHGGAIKLMLPVSLWAEIADEVTRPEQGPCVSAEGR